jgi:hypothetical protein
MLVRALACADHSAFQRRADKKAFRFAVGINCRSRCHIGLGSASHWSRRHARVRSERHISALGKRANGALVVEHNHKIGHLRADLRPQPAPPVPMNDGPDQPCPVRATTTPSPAFPLKIRPALTTLIMARPRACRRMRDGMLFSGIWRNSRIVAAERLTVSCSVAFAPISDKEKIVRMENSLFIAVQLLRRLKGAWTCLFNKDVDLPRLLGERR